MAILQAITDNLTALNAEVATVSSKVDALLASNAGAASPAEQQTIADGIAAATTVLTAVSAKLP